MSEFADIGKKSLYHTTCMISSLIAIDGDPALGWALVSLVFITVFCADVVVFARVITSIIAVSYTHLTLPTN